MAVRSGFWNSVGTDRRTYYNRDFSHLISLLIKDGIHQTYGESLIVKTVNDLNALEVIVPTGEAWFNNTWVLNDSDYLVELDAAPVVSGFKRIDAIAIKIDETQSVREGTIEYVKGTETSSTPVAPILTDTDDIHWHLLATVAVNNGDAHIDASAITNYVGTSQTPFISGILSTISADILMNKWQGEFDEWFDHMKDQLSEDAAGHLQEEVDDINDCIRTNLFNPKGQTQTLYGVTLTNNGDGTYTVNGTASANITFKIGSINGKVGQKMIGCPSNTPSGIYLGYLPNDEWINVSQDSGDGVIIKAVGTSDQVCIAVENGQTANNLLFKPMLTTDLNAKYDNYVPYTGDSGRLNEDVSQLNSDLTDIGNNKQNKTDNALATTAKTIVGAINELVSSLSSAVTTLTNRIAKHETDVGNWYNAIRVYSKTEDTANVNAGGSTTYNKAGITVPAGTYIIIRQAVRTSGSFDEHIIDLRVGEAANTETQIAGTKKGQTVQFVTIQTFARQTTLKTWFVAFRTGGSGSSSITIRASTTAIRIK